MNNWTLPLAGVCSLNVEPEAFLRLTSFSLGSLLLARGFSLPLHTPHCAVTVHGDSFWIKPFCLCIGLSRIHEFQAAVIRPCTPSVLLTLAFNTHAQTILRSLTDKEYEP